MDLSHLIAPDGGSLSIIGFSKNAGKTTVMNALIGLYSERDIVGVVSAGVDGEERDVWSHLPKPPVLIPKNGCVVTAGYVLDQHPGNWEVLAALDQETMVGPLFVARARKKTVVKLIGVPSASQLHHILHVFKDIGARHAFVDGAYNRKAFASPKITDRTLAVVGASAGTSLEQILPKVEEFVHYFTLLECEDPEFRKAGQRAIENRGVVLVEKGGLLDLPQSSLIHIHEIGHLLHKKEPQCIASPGLITDGIIRKLIEQKKGVTLLVPDATHLFSSYRLVQQFYRCGGKIEVMQATRLAGIAVNPTSPEGYSFDPLRMMMEVERRCPGIPVFDVVREVLM